MGLPFMQTRLDGLIRSEPIVGLTTEGQARITQHEGEGPRYDVMATLKESRGGKLPVSELAEQCHMSVSKTKHIVKELISAGYLEIRRGG